METDKISKQYIHQHWKHAHEEDQGNQLIFRPITNIFLPSRGRQEFNLEKADSCIFLDIAQGDGQDEIKCKLKFENDTITIIVDYPNGRQRMFELVSVEADKLVLSEHY